MLKTTLRRELFSVERSNEIDFELPTRDVLVEGVLKWRAKLDIRALFQVI